MASMETVLHELSKPFHPSHITWKPGATNRDKTKALGMSYADVRAYQNRLDEVCDMNWSVSYTPWGDRIVCHLTIFGVTRSSTGEGDNRSEKSEIAGTVAEAQAFKRACAMFGLGRYLYNLPTVWAETDSNGKFTDQGQARLNNIVVQHYRRNTEDSEKATPEPTQPPEQSPPTDNDKPSWTAKPDTLLFANEPYEFANMNEALDWGIAMGIFNAMPHCKNAYNQVKAEKKPTKPSEMWAAWIEEVARRVNEKKAAA